MNILKYLHTIAFTLINIGALNWGLVGAFHFNLVEKILGMGMVSEIVYCLVGLSAIYEVATHAKRCRQCKPDHMASSMPSNPGM